MRSFLTSLGIVFGVAAVIAMMAIGKGAQEEILSMIESVGSNNIIIEKKLDKSSSSDGANKKKSRVSNGLSLKDVDGISKAFPKIKNISPEVSYEMFVIAGERSANLRLVGVGNKFFEMFNYQTSAGKFFSEYHEKNALPVCVIGQQTANRLFIGESPIGQDIKCGGNWYKIIGLIDTQKDKSIKTENMGIRNPGEDIFIPVTTLVLRQKNKKLITKKAVEQANNTDDEDSNQPTAEETADYHELDKIIVQVESTEYVEELAQIISRFLFRVHNESLDFEIQIPELLLKQEQRSKAIFNIVLGIIAGISLLIGGIGIMNIMLASVMERIKEIGIRMAIGASEKDIILQFLVETVLLSVGGGLIGVVLGILISYLIEFFADIKTIISLFSILISFSVSALIGIIFGFMPAKRAANQDPVISLRS